MDLIKRRVLLIGANGKLGNSVARSLAGKAGLELLCSDSGEKLISGGSEYTQTDITKRNSVKELFHKFFPDVVINTAGFTNVDACELNKELSWNVNVKGTENIAASAWAIDADLIHISSDYIFDGKEGPYTEEDVPHPISYYGRTKLAAENSLRTSGVRFTIFRTNVLYGSNSDLKPDFVRWAVKSLKEGLQIKIVTDQINNPTYIEDLTNVIIGAIDKETCGIFNIGGAEIINRYEFTCRIARYFKLDESLIIPIKTADLKQPAPRPLKSGLIIAKAVKELGYKPTEIEETFRLIAGSVA